MHRTLQRVTNPLQAVAYFKSNGDDIKTVEELVTGGVLYFLNPATGEIVRAGKSYFY